MTSGGLYSGIYIYMVNVKEMAVQFSNLVNEALDEVAPFKSFNTKSGYKAGLSHQTKIFMAGRDRARHDLKTSPGDKWIALKKYKTLHNRVNQQVRNEVKIANGKRIDDANKKKKK